MITADKDKEELLYETFFTGKHLLDLPRDQQTDNYVTKEFNKIEHLKCEPIKETGTQDEHCNIHITIEEITAAIKNQDCNDKSCDTDNVHPLILKHLGTKCLHLLQAIYNKCMDTGKWLWKTSYVSFIRKEGKSSYMAPGAYRPISISSYFGKILERVLDRRLRQFLGITESLDSDQEGFIEGRSTTRYLFRLIANLEEVKKQKMACIILFLDFEKAFDSVHLPTLCLKLQAKGISGNIFKVLQGFLFNRDVCLKVNNHKGGKRKCTIYGLPQGAVLSPLLFIIYVLDMGDSFTEDVKSHLNCFKFADDGTLVITFENMLGCHRLMQLVCDQLSIWCIRNKLVINCDLNKTEAIILKTAAHNDEQMPPELLINGLKIKYVKSTRVLGIILDDEINFKQHTLQKLKECNKKWGLITKATNRNYGLNVNSLTLLLKTMILTKLLYAAPIWLHKCINMCNGFWNKIIMKISGAVLNPQRELTELALHLPPLSVQLEIITVKFMCKVLTGGDHVTATLYQIDERKLPQFHTLTLTLKKYLVWKANMSSPNKVQRSRQIEITQPCYKDLAFYNRADIDFYKQKIWIETVEGNILHKTVNCDKESKILGITTKLKDSGTLLGKDNFVFRHNTSKELDSRIMDYIHGSSPLFGNTRKVMGLSTEDGCNFCTHSGDSPEHQLLKCKEVQDGTYEEFVALMEGSYPDSYLEEVLIPKNCNTQRNFVNRVDFLWGQHQYLEDLLNYSWWHVNFRGPNICVTIY